MNRRLEIDISDYEEQALPKRNQQMNAEDEEEEE
jgi:hypothetical protein